MEHSHLMAVVHRELHRMPTYERRPTNEQQPHNTYPWNRGLPVGGDKHLRCHGTHIGGQIPRRMSLRPRGPSLWWSRFARWSHPLLALSCQWFRGLHGAPGVASRQKYRFSKDETVIMRREGRWIRTYQPTTRTTP